MSIIRKPRSPGMSYGQLGTRSGIFKYSNIILTEDRETGRSKGFAFITMEDSRDAKDALAANGKLIDDREVC